LLFSEQIRNIACVYRVGVVVRILERLYASRQQTGLQGAKGAKDSSAGLHRVNRFLDARRHAVDGVPLGHLLGLVLEQGSDGPVILDDRRHHRAEDVPEVVDAEPLDLGELTASV
jgi:hypothetical protein